MTLPHFTPDEAALVLIDYQVGTLQQGAQPLPYDRVIIRQHHPDHLAISSTAVPHRTATGMPAARTR